MERLVNDLARRVSDPTRRVGDRAPRVVWFHGVVGQGIDRVPPALYLEKFSWRQRAHLRYATTISRGFHRLVSTTVWKAFGAMTRMGDGGSIDRSGGSTSWVAGSTSGGRGRRLVARNS